MYVRLSTQYDCARDVVFHFLSASNRWHSIGCLLFLISVLLLAVSIAKQEYSTLRFFLVEKDIFEQYKTFIHIKPTINILLMYKCIME